MARHDTTGAGIASQTSFLLTPLPDAQVAVLNGSVGLEVLADSLHVPGCCAAGEILVYGGARAQRAPLVARAVRAKMPGRGIPRGEHHGPLAQLAEQLTLNQPVLGSTPGRLTIQ